jgi:IS66 C-terminal element
MTGASNSTPTRSNVRKNHLFAGSDGGGACWAVVASLLTTAKNDVEPFAYLKDVLERMSNGYPMSRLEDRAASGFRSSGIGCCGSMNGAPTACLTASRRASHRSSMMFSAKLLRG